MLKTVNWPTRKKNQLLGLTGTLSKNPLNQLRSLADSYYPIRNRASTSKVVTSAWRQQYTSCHLETYFPETAGWTKSHR